MAKFLQILFQLFICFALSLGATMMLVVAMIAITDLISIIKNRKNKKR